MSYVFSAGHQHYVWYRMYNLNNTKKVPSLIEKAYFCVDHTASQWELRNGVWSDSYIKTTFMSCRKGPWRLNMYYNSLTLNYCLHISTQIFQDLNEICIDPLKEVRVQKEKTRHVKTDGVNHEKICIKLNQYMIDHQVTPSEIVSMWLGSVNKDPFCQCK